MSANNNQKVIDYNMRIMHLDKEKLISEARRLFSIINIMIENYKKNNPNVEIKLSTNYLACPQFLNENQLNTLKNELQYFYCNLPQTFGQMVNCPIDNSQLETFISMINDVIAIGNREADPEPIKKKYDALFYAKHIYKKNIPRNK